MIVLCFLDINKDNKLINLSDISNLEVYEHEVEHTDTCFGNLHNNNTILEFDDDNQLVEVPSLIYGLTSSTSVGMSMKLVFFLY